MHSLCRFAGSLVLVLALVPSAGASKSFMPRYGPTKTELFSAVQSDLRQARLLEQITDALSSGIQLPRPLFFGTAECGTPNAFYAPGRMEIVICLELVQHLSNGISRRYSRVSPPDEISQMINGALNFIIFHELGHALIDVLKLPILGREEDAADQIGTFFMLNMAGTPQALAGALWFFEDSSFSYSRAHFAGVHSLGPQRQANLACWTFGSDSKRYSYLLASAMLTRERSQTCQREFRQLDSAVRQLLGNAVQLPSRR
jgi:hypothetical protein